MNKFEAGHSSSEKMGIEQFAKQAGLEMEIISDVPVFTIETDRKDEAISRVSQFFGENTVFRIINAHFVDDAIEFGTDKGRVDEHDYRRVADGSGYDVWGVEKQALKQGLRKSDVFCGTPYKMFAEEGSEFSSSGLGIPNDRAAILVYDGEKVQEVAGSEEMGGISDGYAFRDVENRRQALIGVMKFKESFVEFERELQKLESTGDKVALLEKEIFQNLNTPGDLKKAPYIALNIIALLHSESLNNSTNPSESSIDQINKLKAIADRLEYEIRMIGIVDNMAGQIVMTREAFATRNERKMDMMQTWPDFVIKTTQSYLQEIELDKKYTDALNQVIEDAKRCNEDLKIGKNRTVQNLQEKTRVDIYDNLQRTK